MEIARTKIREIMKDVMREDTWTCCAENGHVCKYEIHILPPREGHQRKRESLYRYPP